jgi:hypothetical protein
MEEKILEEIKEKHMRADSTISLFFISIDTIFYITILTYLGCRFKNFFTPKQMLSNIILVDVLIRLLYIYYNSFDYILLNEVCFTCLSTVQFFLLNSIFKKMFKDEYYDGTETLEIQSPFLLSLIFFFLAFTFNISKPLSLIQYVLAIIAVISYAYYIQSRINLLLNNMQKRGVEITCKRMSINLIYLIALYFVIFYGLKLSNLFIENKLYYSYILMAGDVFKEGAKFLLFGLMILIIKSFNRFTKDADEFSGDKENIY